MWCGKWHYLSTNSVCIAERIYCNGHFYIVINPPRRSHRCNYWPQVVTNPAYVTFLMASLPHISGTRIFPDQLQKGRIRKYCWCSRAVVQCSGWAYSSQGCSSHRAECLRKTCLNWRYYNRQEHAAVWSEFTRSVNEIKRRIGIGFTHRHLKLYILKLVISGTLMATGNDGAPLFWKFWNV